MPVKERVGIVVSTKMEKTIVVQVESRFSHPIYSKTMVKTKKYLVLINFAATLIAGPNPILSFDINFIL